MSKGSIRVVDGSSRSSPSLSHAGVRLRERIGVGGDILNLRRNFHEANLVPWLHGHSADPWSSLRFRTAWPRADVPRILPRCVPRSPGVVHDRLRVRRSSVDVCPQAQRGKPRSRSKRCNATRRRACPRRRPPLSPSQSVRSRPGKGNAAGPASHGPKEGVPGPETALRLEFPPGILGHNSILTTQKYLRSLGVEDLQAAHEGLSPLTADRSARTT
jgi:hypothetical protein